MARLRNRIRKADYFTDGELLRWHRDKRATYSALWALAEDSGCLEDDPFMWKMTIWPSPLDTDITVETMQQWRDELVEAGKLIPYTVKGKPFLFIRTFHQHEMPRNPQMNDLPLPPWVKRETVEGVDKKGRRFVRHRYCDEKYTEHNRYGDCSAPVQAASGNGNGPVRADSSTKSRPLPCPALSRVPKGTRGTGQAGLSPNGSSPPLGDGTRICWRCKQPITGDDMCEDRVVETKRGLRHVDCPKVEAAS